jgi:glycosyltransferase involved in cell wall biosynthesis
VTHNVVHYADSSVFGGVEQVTLMLLSGLNRKQWRPLLYCHEQTAPERLVRGAIDAGVECRMIRAPQSLRDWRALHAFRSQLLEDKPKVFHAHLNWPLSCRLGLVAAMLARVPQVVATSHLFHPVNQIRFSKLKQGLQSALIDTYVAVSREVARGLRDELNVPESKIRVVHNGIALPMQTSADTAVLRAELLGGPDRPIVLTAARLHPQKGHDGLLEAAVHVQHALFVLAGDGPDRERLQAKAATLGISDRVRFIGQRTDVVDLLAACDLFVLPSLYEGLPLGLLEAMAAGKPVVATAVGGTTEVVVDGVHGCLVAPRNAVALASAINGLLGDPGRAARMAAGGQVRIKERFSVESMVRATEVVYEDALAGRGAGEPEHAT